MADQRTPADHAAGPSGTGFRWDPDHYEAFADHRARPFLDLTARIDAASPRRVVDLGCGPGTMTAVLARRWPEAEVVGLDASAEMVAAAEAREGRPPNLRFDTVDARTWAPGPGTDVVVSNAMLQWLPGHRDLVRGWLAALEPGAWFAAQVPAQHGSPSHASLHELAAQEPFRAVLAGERSTDTVAAPADYAADLLAAGWDADVWETTYQQALTGPYPVVAFTSSTVMRPFLQRLAEHDDAAGTSGTENSLEQAFREEYRRRMAEAYPRVPGTGEGDDATVLFGFRRIFMVGRRPA